MNKLILQLVVSLIMLFLTFTADAGNQINWQVISESGGGIPEVEIDKNVILASREEIIFGNDSNKSGRRVVCSRSNDNGKNWEDISVILESPDNDIDLGDGSMINIGNHVYYIYRYNQFSGKHLNKPYYSIRVKKSSDGGKTWIEHSIVEEIYPPKGRKSGLWTPRLFYTASGKLQAYYDDGDMPERERGGKNQGQWGVMKTWNDSMKRWEKLTVVSRPPKSVTGPLSITADGARTPIELTPGHIWSPVESVTLDNIPGSRSLVLKYAESFDDGVTWSWSKNEWPILYNLPPKFGGENYDWSWPLATRLKDGSVVVLFRSNEVTNSKGEKTKPIKGTAHQTNKEVYYLFSNDNCKTWTKNAVLPGMSAVDHGLASLRDGSVLAGIRSKTHVKQYVILKGVVAESGTGKSPSQ